MTDIVEQLRKRLFNSDVFERPKGSRSGSMSALVCEEAADEIERLRVECNKWKTQAGVQNCGLSMANEDCETKDTEIERLRTLLKESAIDMHATIDQEYANRDQYPFFMRRYKRDMDLVNRIDEALAND